MKTTKQKILVVDDQPENIQMLRHVLASDYKVYFALNGQNALNAIEANPPDLILLDIVMPGMDGFAVCAHLKAQEKTQNIPVIFITAKNEKQDETRGLALGAVDFIIKPFNPPVVKARVQTHLKLINTFAQLRDRKEHLRSILDNAMDAMITTDADGHILEFNPSAEDLFGYTRGEATGQEISTLILQPERGEPYREEMRHFVQQATQSDRLKRRFETIGLRRDGGRITIEIALVGTRKGETVSFTAFVHDMTEHHILLDSLNQTLKAAEVANRTKSDFLANMSHEIRTPMNAIIGLTQLAMDVELTPKLRDYLTKIDRASHSMSSVINDILDFSRIESGKMRLTPVQFHLHDLLSHLNDMFLHQVVEKGIALRWSMAEDIPPLWGDAMRLEQVLTNLIGNAIKFTEKGEIVVQVTLRERHSRRVVLAFSVHDNGIGIAPSRLTELFEPFVQADGSITRKYGGTGLGLVICKRIVAMMGGTIRVESREGEGSTFHFTAAFEPLSDHQKEGGQPITGLHQLKVLLVGDPNPALREIERILHSLTFLTTSVLDLPGTIAALREGHETGSPYALLLLHQNHSGEKMIEMFTSVTQTLSGFSPPIVPPKGILLTSDHDVTMEKRALAAGMQACFTQPLKRSLLFNTLLTLFGVTAVYATSTEDLANAHTQLESTLGGARVLVVEDNPINRQVIRELLERVGIRVEEADHGGTALRMLQTTSYNLVLMDIQMPEMDGLTATRIIRSNKQFDPLPIIAMTAHAMEEDKQKCLEVGMNDHVGKPINLRELYRVLAKWAITELPPEAMVPETVSNRPTTLPHLPGVDTEAGLARLAGNAVLYEKLLHQLHEEHAQDAERIAQALANHDPTLAERLAHTIKSIAGQLGAHALHKAARNLEEGIAQKDQPIDPLVNDFSATLAEVMAGLVALSPQPSAVTVPEAPLDLDRETLAPVLQQLAVLLREQDSKADTLLEPLCTPLRGHPVETLSRALAQQLKHYDYDSALDTLGEIAHTIGISLA